jgi:hypothetical protein
MYSFEHDFCLTVVPSGKFWGGQDKCTTFMHFSRSCVCQVAFFDLIYIHLMSEILNVKSHKHARGADNGDQSKKCRITMTFVPSVQMVPRLEQAALVPLL